MRTRFTGERTHDRSRIGSINQSFQHIDLLFIHEKRLEAQSGKALPVYPYSSSLCIECAGCLLSADTIQDLCSYRFIYRLYDPGLQGFI